MYGLMITELAQVAEQEHMERAMMARARRAARAAASQNRQRGRGRRVWASLWAYAIPSREARRVALSTGSGDQLCSDC